MTTTRFRELSMTADSLFRFLRAVTQERPVRVEHERIPKSASLAGVSIVARATAEPGDNLVTLNIFDQWRDQPDDGTPLEIVYTQQVGNTGQPGDWGTPVLLTAPRSPS